MRSTVLLPLLIAALAVPGVSAADDTRTGEELFAVFRAVCIDHAGDLDGAKAAALQQGLAPPTGPAPPVMAPPVVASAPGASDGPKETLLSPGGQGSFRWFILLSSGIPSIQGLESTACQLTGGDRDGSLYREALAWQAFDPPAGNPNRAAYIFRQTPDGAVLLNERELKQVKPFAQRGELRIYSFDTNGSSTTLRLSTPAPPAP